MTYKLQNATDNMALAGLGDAMTNQAVSEIKCGNSSDVSPTAARWRAPAAAVAMRPGRQCP
jgi:hypothetical protein